MLTLDAFKPGDRVTLDNGATALVISVLVSDRNSINYKVYYRDDKRLVEEWVPAALVESLAEVAE